MNHFVVIGEMWFYRICKENENNFCLINLIKMIFNHVGFWCNIVLI